MTCSAQPHLPENMIRYRSISINDDGSHFVITDLLQQRGGIQTFIQHSHRQRLSGDKEVANKLL